MDALSIFSPKPVQAKADALILRPPAARGKQDEEGNFILDFSGGVRPTPIDFWITPRVSPRADMMPPDFASVDFETFYTPTYSLTNLSTWEYVTHHAFDCYLVSICKAVGNRWRCWIGHPMDAPWGGIAGLPWVSHNAEFDNLVHKRLVKDGLVPALYPSIWDCTADLGIYLQAGRSLKDVAKALFGLDLDKSIRDKMIGQRTADDAINQYAALDAIVCAEIWYNYSAYWPRIERYISQKTRQWGWEGIHVDKEACIRDIGKLEFAKHLIKKQLPWGQTGSVASILNVRKQCFKIGILPPPNLDLDNDETLNWVNQYSDKYNWVALIRDHTQCHQMAGFMRLLLERQRTDGTVPYNLNYCGAPHTQRFTSGKRLRMQNLNRAGKEVKGADGKEHEINLRAKFVPGPGEVFLIADSSQIEPRVLHWLIGNKPFLDYCLAGLSPYEAHARASMGYNDPIPLKKKDAIKYLLAKYQVLALGYQAAAEKYIIMAKTQGGFTVALDRPLMMGPKGDTWELREWDKAMHENRLLTPVETYGIIPSAIETVSSFRENNPLIVNFWKDNEAEMRACLGRDYTVVLPSGGHIRYFDVREQFNPYRQCKELYADVIKNPNNPKNTKSFYGGKLTENKVQRVAREVLVYFIAVISSQMPEVNIKWHVHDEIIASCPRHLAEKNLAQMLKIMHTPPPWALGLPVAAEGSIETCYTK